MHHMGLNIPGTGSTSCSLSHSTSALDPPMQPGDSAQDSDSDLDPFAEEIHNPGQPSTALITISQGQEGADNSFGSSNHSSDPLNDVGAGQGGMVHPLADMRSSDGGEFGDDYFDDDFVGS